MKSVRFGAHVGVVDGWLADRTHLTNSTTTAVRVLALSSQKLIPEYFVLGCSEKQTGEAVLPLRFQGFGILTFFV